MGVIGGMMELNELTVWLLLRHERGEPPPTEEEWHAFLTELIAARKERTGK